MNLKLVFSPATRWGAAAAAAATAAVMGLAAAPAQAVVGQGSPARSGATVVAAAGGLSGGSWGDPTADGVSKDASGRYQPKQDPGSLFTVDKAIGARKLWGEQDSSGRSLTGQGVTVALLDSGVAPVAGLDGAGKVTYGPDLSIEGNGVLTQQDTFGHGTFMAGIIAGRGATNPSSDLPTAPAGANSGCAVKPRSARRNIPGCSAATSRLARASVGDIERSEHRRWKLMRTRCCMPEHAIRVHGVAPRREG